LASVAGTKKFWLSCLTDLKNRGVTDIFITCVDGLTGFPEAIQTAFPQARVQLCIVHLVRAALKYVTDADSREVIRDLRNIDQAATVLEAEQELKTFGERWGAKYPTIVKQWTAKWPHIISMFDLPPAIRKATYTTNMIESVNSVIRPCFPCWGHPQPKTRSEPRVSPEADLPGDSRNVEEMDHADSQVERRPQPLRHPLRRPYAKDAQLTHDNFSNSCLTQNS